MNNKNQSFRSSGHIRDLMLRKALEDEQPALFDILRPETKQSIARKSVSIEMINKRGSKIELTASEWKIIDVFSEFLHENSINNSNPDEYGFYLSKYGQDSINYGGISGSISRLDLTFYEIAKKYKGGEFPSGKDIKTVKTILEDWANKDEKRVLIRYRREETTKDKKKRVHIIETFQPLISIFYEQFTEYNSDDKEINRFKKIIVYLNPIFRDQIETKYINYPIGLTKLMIEAWGGHVIPEIVFKLRDYLAREISSKRVKCEIGIENLCWLLDEKSMKLGKRKRIYVYLEKAIVALKKLGLIQDHFVEQNKKAEDKLVFILNPNWTLISKK